MERCGCALAVALAYTVGSRTAPPSPEAQQALEVAVIGSALGLCLLVGLAEVHKARQMLRLQPIEASLFETLNYRLECWWATTSYAIPLSLVYVIFTLNLVGGCLFAVANRRGLFDSTFTTWLFMSDPGAQADAMGLIPFAMTIAGLLCFGFLISLITEYVGDKVSQIKKGNSRVIESGHTVILGHSSHLEPLIKQIALANESEGGGTVAVLTDRGLERTATQSTRVVVRTGSPLEWDDLRIVSVETARVIICLADNEVSADESDAFVMRTTLVLSAFENVAGYVVAEIRDVDNKERIELTSEHKTECIVAHDLIGRLMIQCARHRGLARVVQELLGFEGDEVYVREWPQLVGLTFLEVQRAFDFATPIGLVVDGHVVVNPQPAAEVRVGHGDKIIVIAEDNDTYRPLPQPVPLDEAVDERLGRQIRSRRSQTLDMENPERQHFLFLGWRRDVMDMIHFLDDVVPPNSTLTIMSTLSVKCRYRDMSENGRKLALHHLTLDHVVGNHVSRRQLQALPLRRYSAILVLSEKSLETNVANKDSLSTAAVVLVRDILNNNADDDNDEHMAASEARHVPPPDAAPSDSTNSSWIGQTLDLLDFVPTRKDSVDTNQDEEDDFEDVDPPPAPSPMSSARSSRPRLRRSGAMKRSASRRGAKLKHALSLMKDPNTANKSKPPPLLICELLDSRMSSTLRRYCEIVASNDCMSRILAMVSESADINAVLSQLLTAASESTLMVQPATMYLTAGEHLSFYQVSLRMQECSDVLVGYFSDDALVINPRDKLKPRTWLSTDRLAIIGCDTRRIANHRRQQLTPRMFATISSVEGDDSEVGG